MEQNLDQKKNTFGMRNTQCSLELSVHKQPSVFNTIYTIQCCVNCPNDFTPKIIKYDQSNRQHIWFNKAFFNYKKKMFQVFKCISDTLHRQCE